MDNESDDGVVVSDKRRDVRSGGGRHDVHEHPEDLNPEAAIHFEGRPPKTAGKTKRQNAIVAVRNHPPPPSSSPGYL